jgi:hypothetical protein
VLRVSRSPSRNRICMRRYCLQSRVTRKLYRSDACAIQHLFARPYDARRGSESMNVTGKLYCLLSVLALSLTASAQTTNTNCTTQTYGSNGQINCTSTTQQPQQQSQAGQQIGTALGGAIGVHGRSISRSRTTASFIRAKRGMMRTTVAPEFAKLPKANKHRTT